MSGIVGSYFNTRGSGVVAKLGTDGQVFTSSGAGVSQDFEAAAGGGGKILQVVSKTWDDNQTGSNDGATFADITEANLAITPASTSNKVLVNFSISGASGAYDTPIYIRLQHNGSGSYADITGCLSDEGTGNQTNMSTIMSGGGAGEYGGTCAYTYLDSPSKDTEFNYQVQCALRWSGGVAWYINCSDDGRDETYVPFYTSTLTLTEIDGS